MYSLRPQQGAVHSIKKNKEEEETKRKGGVARAF
jgi:hypothetical protein